MYEAMSQSGEKSKRVNQVQTRKWRRELEESEAQIQSKQTFVQDMEKVLTPYPDDFEEEPPIPHDLPEDKDSWENTEIPQVKVDLIEDDTNEDEWH